ncbi:MAG TPA: hypothetical protein VHS81_07810 [Caulobacteraceae bacterium]|jgi:hypothetical protein|nr:hypothetical protein [Caulobacteraceae bacterium]
MTGEAWFRARRSDEGVGYGLTHWKGAVAVVLVALIGCGVGALPLLVFGTRDIALAGGFVLGFSTFTILLLALVRLKAERWEG